LWLSDRFIISTNGMQIDCFVRARSPNHLPRPDLFNSSIAHYHLFYSRPACPDHSLSLSLSLSFTFFANTLTHSADFFLLSSAAACACLFAFMVLAPFPDDQLQQGALSAFQAVLPHEIDAVTIIIVITINCKFASCTFTPLLRSPFARFHLLLGAESPQPTEHRTCCHRLAVRIRIHLQPFRCPDTRLAPLVVPIRVLSVPSA
jgi:hypothetical protein